uniref:AWS domain-containing protein n=1 Tax=Caenorhabditis tropicalis TaxID=1561998 RepID=A0A1I7TEA2_9PELO
MPAFEYEPIDQNVDKSQFNRRRMVFLVVCECDGNCKTKKCTCFQIQHYTCSQRMCGSFPTPPERALEPGIHR